MSLETKFSGANGEQGRFHFSFSSADHEQCWQPYPVDAHCLCGIIFDGHAYMRRSCGDTSLDLLTCDVKMSTIDKCLRDKENKEVFFAYGGLHQTRLKC